MCCKNCKEIELTYEIVDRVPNIPYKEYYSEKFNTYIREFDKNCNDLDLQWHFDDEDRTIIVIGGATGWQFQFDNELPFELHDNCQFSIGAGIYHRIIKSKAENNLSLIIYKNK